MDRNQVGVLVKWWPLGVCFAGCYAGAGCQDIPRFLLRAVWNGELLAELHGFPDLKHDDQVDALSGAGAALLALGPVTAAAQVVSREAARELFG